MNSKYLVGVTGGIGSGKSFICSILEKMGYPVFYSDKASKHLLATHPNIISNIKELLGEEAYFSDGSVNRAYIANQIFKDQQKLESMNGIMHPAVREAFRDFSEQQNSPIVFNEAAIIFETGSYSQFDKTILVTAPKSLKLERVLERDQTSRASIEERMKNQWTDEQKIPLANYIIHNGESDMILPQIDTILNDILK